MKEIADKIVNELKVHGFIIQRYDSMSSRSIYLKLDYGVAYSIRISDHPGKKHLKYRFNVRTDMESTKYEMVNGYKRYYFGADNIHELISEIIQQKQEKIKLYGEKSYKYFMHMNVKKADGKKGFWQHAKEV